MASKTYVEIKDQFNRMVKTENYLTSKLEEIEALVAQYETIVYIGCGSSYSLAKSLAAATMMHMDKKAAALPAGDIMLRPESYRGLIGGSLIVALSRSGSTSEVLLACEGLKAANIAFSLMSISCTEGKQVAKISDLALEMPWAFDHSVCQTSSVSNIYFAGMMIIAYLSDNKMLQADLLDIAALGSTVLDNNELEYERIAKLGWTTGVVLGDAEIIGIAEEAALAFKEICQLPSNQYPLLDSRHGPFVLFNKDTLVVAAISDVNSEYEKALIEELVEKKCTVVTVSELPVQIKGTVNFNAGKALTYPTLGLILANAVQTITYYKAIERGVDPDQPTGLDAWIKL